jgi:hypothetical protein
MRWRFNKEICFHLRRAFSAQKGGGRRRLPAFSLHVLGPEIYFACASEAFIFFKCVDGQLHFCLTLDAAQFVAHRKNSKVTSVLIKSNWVGTLEVFLKAFWVRGSGAVVEDCVMFNVSVIESIKRTLEQTYFIDKCYLKDLDSHINLSIL